MEIVTKESATEVKITTVVEDENIVSYFQLLREKKNIEQKIAAARISLELVEARILEAERLGVK